MNPRVKAAKPNPDYTITLVFTNGEVKRFDVKPYLNIGVFHLRSKRMVCWKD